MLVDQAQALELLHQGEVIACPTESVYGLSCDATNTHAIEKIMALKQRDSAKGLIVIISDFAMLDEWVDALTPEQRLMLSENWPGPVTFLMPVQNKLSPLLQGGFETQAIRMSAHHVLSSLVQAFGKPIVSTSANVSHQAPARSITDLEKYFGDELSIVSGDLGSLNKPTSIIDLLTMDKIR